MHYDIIGSGALNLDLIYEVESLEMVRREGFSLEPGRELSGSYSDLDRLEKLLARSGRLVSRSGGGSAANTVCALAAMGRRSAFTGYVGDDDYGSFILNSMEGVDLGMVRRQGSSSVCVVIIEKSGPDRAMFAVPGSCHGDFKDIDLCLDNCRCLHLSSLAMDDGPGLQRCLVDSIGKETIFSFDPGEIYASRGLDDLRFFLDRTDILFITEEEIRMLSGSAGPGDTLPSWISPQSLLVKKMGPRGAMSITKGEVFEKSASHVNNIVDNTGAGDAFNAGFLDFFLDDMAIEACLENGVKTAALSLGDYGRHWISRL